MFSQVTRIQNIYQVGPSVDSLTWCKIPHENINGSSSSVIQTEEEYDRLLPTLFECFAIVFCGFLAGKCNLISPSDIKGLNDFTTYFSLPPLIFLNLATINLQHINWNFILGVLLGKVSVFILVALVTATVQRPINLSYAGLYGIFCTQGNDFGLAYPIVSSLYRGKRPDYPGYMYLIAPTSLLFTNPMGFFLMEIQKNKNTANSITKSETNIVRRFLKTLSSVSWNVFKSPVVFVTLLGILGNFLFQNRLPDIMFAILQILSSAFSACVLFLLGFSVVRCGTTKSTKEGLLIPAVLIIAKMLLSPLITRSTVALLCSGASDVGDLADYGFLYGMVPTGPIVMLFAAEYALRTEMIASTMVICTALFGPIMFVLARMLSFKVRGLEQFSDELKTTMIVLSIMSLLACIWVGVCMIIGKKFKKHLYKITGFLMLSQIILSIGVLTWATNHSKDTWLKYLQVSCIAGGQLMTKIFVVLLALFLAIKERDAFSPFIQNLSWTISFGFGIPTAVVLMVLVLTGVGKYQPEMQKELPLFIYGNPEALVSIIVLFVCLFVTSLCLVIYWRSLVRTFHWEHKQAHSKDTASLDMATSEQDKPIEKLTECAGLAVYRLTKDPMMTINEKEEATIFPGFAFVPKKLDDEDDDSNQHHRCNTKDERSVSSGSRSSLDIISVTSSGGATSPSDSSEFDEDSSCKGGQSHLRHVILLILCCISMAIGLTVSMWKLSTKQPNGLFVAMEFLDAVLNVAQGLFILFIFWRESKHILTPVAKWIRHVRRGFYNFEGESTDDNTTYLCRQFRRFHWSNCLRDLPRTFSTEEESYSECFTGKELVDWLMAVGLATHRTAAEIYGQQLVRGGLLTSANGAIQFRDNHAYFYQLKDSEKYI